mmetsp:Transcript_24363/g.45730  ORF Transcript_24363/g.45730 Transcript_24363/m.45730 type:complete len:202 (+) Transcript_24363:1252-1857(+)
MVPRASEDETREQQCLHAAFISKARHENIWSSARPQPPPLRQPEHGRAALHLPPRNVRRPLQLRYKTGARPGRREGVEERVGNLSADGRRRQGWKERQQEGLRCLHQSRAKQRQRHRSFLPHQQGPGPAHFRRQVGLLEEHLPGLLRRGRSGPEEGAAAVLECSEAQGVDGVVPEIRDRQGGCEHQGKFGQSRSFELVLSI